MITTIIKVQHKMIRVEIENNKAFDFGPRVPKLPNLSFKGYDFE